MYGLVNKAIEGLVRSNHGDAVWQQIVATAGLELSGFVSLESYDDDVTYKLVNAASEVLGASAEAILEGFGEYWITYTADEGYGQLLERSGDTIEEFLENLDQLHTRVGLTMPHLRPPTIHSDLMDDGSIRLEYYSEREGLAPMVVGLMRGLAGRFGQSADVTWLERREENGSCDVFNVRLSQANVA
jgi:hypothetical protein